MDYFSRTVGKAFFLGGLKNFLASIFMDSLPDSSLFHKWVGGLLENLSLSSTLFERDSSAKAATRRKKTPWKEFPGRRSPKKVSTRQTFSSGTPPPQYNIHNIHTIITSFSSIPPHDDSGHFPLYTFFFLESRFWESALWSVDGTFPPKNYFLAPLRRRGY